MGAWGTGPFDNDIAADWVLEVEASDDPRTAVVDAFESALAPDGLDDGSADMAYGAAAWVATDGDAEDGAPNVRAPALDPVVRDLATRSLQRMSADGSPWLELWDDPDEVVQKVSQIIRRLAR